MMNRTHFCNFDFSPGRYFMASRHAIDSSIHTGNTLHQKEFALHVVSTTIDLNEVDLHKTNSSLKRRKRISLIASVNVDEKRRRMRKRKTLAVAINPMCSNHVPHCHRKETSNPPSFHRQCSSTA